MIDVGVVLVDVVYSGTDDDTAVCDVEVDSFCPGKRKLHYRIFDYVITYEKMANQSTVRNP